MIEIARIKSHQAELLQQLRLKALKDTPDAFLETYDDAREHPIEYWRESAKRNAISPTSTYFLGYVNDNPAGMIGAYVVDDGFRDTGVREVSPAKPDAIGKKMEYDFFNQDIQSACSLV